MVLQPRRYTAFAPDAPHAVSTKASSSATPAAALAPDKIYIDMPPARIWDVTGEWRITAPRLAESLGLPKLLT